jgi:glycosyltransferase involved in cell wall biosynthesis
VITPVHNNGEYISECIESILAQTYQNLEYIIVNNCSKDDSAVIARRYAARDSRIRVLDNKTFLPVMANHNAALRQVSLASKYTKVVFADDWIFPRCLEEMVAVAEEHSTIGVVGALSLQGRRVMWSGLRYPSRLVAGRDVARQLLLRELYGIGSPNAVLYRSDLVRSRDHFYTESNIHGDTEAAIAAFRDWDFGFVHQVLTFTRERPESLTSASSHLQTSYAGTLQILREHGAAFLSPTELEAATQLCLREYYDFLGKSVLLTRDSGFWDYHKRRLKEVGAELKIGRLAWATAAFVVREMLNPAAAVAKVRKRSEGWQNGKAATQESQAIRELKSGSTS